MNGWSPTDWRKMVGLIVLGGGGIACSAAGCWGMYMTAQLAQVKGVNVWPVAYQGMGWQVLTGIVLTGFSAILGRRVFKLQVAGSTVESVGEDAATKIEDAANKEPA